MPLGCVRAVLNMEQSPNMGWIFDFESKKRDIFIQGTCDDSITELCKLLEWDEELKELQNKFERVHTKILERAVSPDCQGQNADLMSQ
ncbi:hypothetical protein RFI_10038 [Reticulomyxa filosa]|uniref:Uncharacterized protein n=1 Tax=Reticulomyxa filosa TaxID=46433 RepID=X6NM57_RETFI|nr:hypothetical protein RFI_10038 [Reticulomyxa filosa]|eukprot:ETO27096.1 hypothetical protein RFI_10038 [Reticulomyxa filosa]